MATYNDNTKKRRRSRFSRLKRLNQRLRGRVGEYRRLLMVAAGVAVMLLFALGFTLLNRPEPDPVLLGMGRAGLKADSVRLANLRADSVRVADSLYTADSLEKAAQLAAAEPAGKPMGGGKASFYGTELAGNPTASGERFNPAQLTAAHRTLPFGTKVKVTNVRNGESVVVRINDRGPYADSRVIDLSTAAAKRIGMLGRGTAMVRIELLR